MHYSAASERDASSGHVPSPLLDPDVVLGNNPQSVISYFLGADFSLPRFETSFLTESKLSNVQLTWFLFVQPYFFKK